MLHCLTSLQAEATTFSNPPPPLSFLLHLLRGGSTVCYLTHQGTVLQCNTLGPKQLCCSCVALASAATSAMHGPTCQSGQLEPTTSSQAQVLANLSVPCTFPLVSGVHNIAHRLRACGLGCPGECHSKLDTKALLLLL